ncbi:MAG: hypothetical protein WC438_05240 [Candidatus Pacearchaeota archaeon]
MISSPVYVLIAIIVLAIIAIILFFTRKNKKQKLTPLAGFAFIFILLGIIGDNRTFSYSLMGIGILLAIIDIIKNKRK